jgi:hypothetical protein
MPETFTEQLLTIADDCGCITYDDALYAADLHSITDAFLEEYGTADRWGIGGIDAGELLTWMGY